METKTIGTTGSYSDAVKQTRNAVSKDRTSESQWKTAGESNRAHFGSESAMREIKAQFIVDAIIPELDKKHQDALRKELPRKGSADYVAFCGSHGAQAWADANQAKKDARSTADVYFNRVVSYAFPSEPKPRTITETKTKIVELINDAIKRAQKDENPDYDVTTLIAQLQTALTTITK
jgi:hypothetical protein